MAISKVLIANRGEIAVRIARACRDDGIASVAVYADPDRDALHVKVADEAYALGGSTPGDSYLAQDKLLDVAHQAGADAVHPGYGFLAENAGFAQAVIDAGLIWIGPGPRGHRRASATRSRRATSPRGRAPRWCPAPPTRSSGPDEVVAFAQEFGLPVAIKAAYGGGGRGLKVARTLEEIPELFESAVREAVTAFGRGECFVERFLDHPRHVETQCLADQHGNVVVVSTRDCSLQRRNQKLVEEAPAPFLTDEQHTELLRASKAILRRGRLRRRRHLRVPRRARTATSRFLEVNTRLQVEHPVTEEVTGIDLVREQFRIADGEPLDYPDPEPHAHSIEFRINGEDAGRGFLPAPGTVTTHARPAGPGRALGLRRRRGRHRRRRVRLDDRQAHRHRPHPPAGARAGPPRARRARHRRHADGHARSTVPSSPTRRSRRPTRTSRSRSTPAGSRPSSTTPSPPYAGGSADAAEAERAPDRRRRGRRQAARGRRCPAASSLGGGGGGGGAARKKAPRRSGGAKAGAAASGDSLTAPMQGTIVKIAVEEGATVAEGDLVVVLEAMKMEQPITAHKAGTVTGLTAEVGATVSNGAVLCEIKDA